MNSMYFWNAWPKNQKKVFQACLTILASAILFYLIGYFWSSRLVIQWETISKVTASPLTLDSWDYASIPLDIKVDQFLINQIYEGSDLAIKSWPAIILLLVLAACLVLALSLAADLPRFWFLVSQVVFIFTLVGFKLEQLLLFERTDKAALILAFLMYLPAGYVFHAVKKEAPLFQRIAVFSVLTVLFALVINYYSGVSHPFLYLVDYGLPVTMGITVIYILFTSHEIIFGFLYLITRSNTPNSSNSFIHFLALSLIYLCNVLFIYLRNARRLEWDFYYVDAFWLLIAAGIIGIWGVRQRKELFKNIMPAEPHAILGYLCLACVSFATIGYFFATANDPAVEALEDAVVFGHLSIGFVFLIYILFNFRSVLIANLKVYKVVYKPTKMPFFSMRLGGLIGVLGLFLLSNQYPLDQAITAYYNGIGDLHRLDDKPMLAKEYYKLAAIYAQTNHRSNYAIASMAKADNDLSEALAYYKQSTIKQPTPFAYVNTARVHEEQGMFFKAMFTLKDGMREFPGDPHISNNLANLYARTDLLDSAYYFLDRPGGGAHEQNVRNTNKLNLLARSGVRIPVDSLLSADTWETPEAEGNLLSIANNLGHLIVPGLTPPVDTLLNPITFTWWYNNNLNQRFSYKGAQMNQTQQLIDIAENQLYSDNLEFSRVLRLYYSGHIAEAFLALRRLQFTHTAKSGYYNDLLGQWSLQHQQPNLALEYFEQSVRAGYLPALWHRSLAFASLTEFEAAASSWGTYIYRSNDSPPQRMSELMNFLKNHQVPWDSLSDRQKFWHLRFKKSNASTEALMTGLEDIKDPGIVNECEAWLWQKWSKGGLMSGSVYQQIQPPEDDPLRRLQLAVVDRDYQEISRSLEGFSTPVFSGGYWIDYGKALLFAQQDDTAQAKLHYQAVGGNPFFEAGIIEASKYFREVLGDEFLSYEILLDALEINKYSIPLLKAYGLQSTRLNLDTYRDTTLETLRGLISIPEYLMYQEELIVIEHSMEREFEQLETETELE